MTANERRLFGRKPIFSDEFENDITEHMKDLAKLFYGITPLQLRSAAYMLAEANKIKHNFNNMMRYRDILGTICTPTPRTALVSLQPHHG
jgi:hypothetical protein